MINRRGYEVVSEEEYYNDIMGKLKEQFPSMSESPSNLLCVLARIIARNENARDYDRVTSYSDAYVATATGMALSKAVRTAGISRLSGTRAVGRVTITKDPTISQAIIPSNMKVTSGNLEYETTNITAIIMNSETMEIEIASTTVGSSFNIADGSKLNPVLNIRGIKSIVASGAISGGTDVESDLILRQRYFERINAYANSSLKGIIDAVAAVDDVHNASGDENVEDYAVAGMAPHSISIYAAGGTDTDIAEAIMKSKPAGVQTNGNIAVDVTVAGRDHTIRFSRFVDQIVYYYIEVAIDRTIAPVDFVNQLQDAVVEYTNTNKKIVAYEIVNYLSQSLEAIKGIRNIYFDTLPDPNVNADLEAPGGMSFTTARANIEVKVI